MPKGGTIYAIGMEGTSLIKIGSTTTSVESRLKLLQTGQPFPLRILAHVPVETDVLIIEHRIHAFLAEERRRGEWFDIALDAEALTTLVVRAVQFVQEKATPRARSAPLWREGMALGERLQQLRMEKKMTQRKLERLAHLSDTAVSKIENGSRTMAAVELKAIADALHVPLDAFFGPDSATATPAPSVD
jgi:DNA-binding XRE family transcriptional regulator